MRRVLAGITIGFLCQGCGQLTGSSDERLKALEARIEALDKKVAVGNQVGRYQVVNPTPEFRVDTKLLDTVTGHTWVLCKNTEGETGWCEMGQASGRGKP